ncbi:hypothetical protein EXU29_08260 [Acinetobacter wuhouensis]|uniref:AbiH family protein n=1 Tax=Acinetobacter wuhouensis TaxID=1879050 RepID=UPI00102398F4|nr:AbiH family protein [Acinetobacter wuhouensis]RZG73314.1 hypothetical protein EXU29_08260 [Acinetobacter wuhouensis]
MNILIVGNGFDLSHYLPTKYDHFMDVMRAIEEKDLGKPITDVLKSSVDDFPTLLIKILQLKNAFNEKNYEMSFHELFSKCREKWFIDKTKSSYSTNEIKLSFEQIVEIQYSLKSNSWYQYFAQHVREIKTWIDFEIKINEALKVISKFIGSIDKKLDELGSFSDEISFYGEKELRQIFLTREQCNLLDTLNILNAGYFIDQEDYDENGYYTVPVDIGDPEHGSLRFYINDQYIQQYSGYGKVSSDNLLNYLQKELNEFIGIFNQYLELIISKLSPTCSFSIDSKDWVKPGKIFSFNYTNTYQRLHDTVEVEYLHGSHGVEQNIVLGVSDLEDESLKKIKAYGFTKYHQKLFKDTDYLFLDKYKKKMILNQCDFVEFKDEYRGRMSLVKEKYLKLKEESFLNLNFFIWGHSLDVSDKDYIIDLFSLNDDMDRNVRVTVYHFNKAAKFDLLNNLLAILGKDKVEHWMKNKWLQFKENPKIVPENAITLEDLPKA